MEHKKIPTTKDVWQAIRTAHGDALGVFASFSNPDGMFMGFSGRGEMMTEYGFHGADCPIIGAETTWDIDEEVSGKRSNEQTRYWLCVAIEST
jgi:hypothetical protein